jgi:hypothetical protein
MNKPPFTWLFRLTRDNCLLGFSPALGVDVIKLLSISRSILLRFEGFSLSSLRYKKKKTCTEHILLNWYFLNDETQYLMFSPSFHILKKQNAINTKERFLKKQKNLTVLKKH